MIASDFRRCLEELDVAGIKAVWRHVAPHLPQSMDDADALNALHMARTAARSIPLRLRAYSHRWLLDRGLPSQLPDRLRPQAERMYPVVVDSVGIAVGFKSELLRPLKPHVEHAMSDAVLECYADGHREPAIVKPRMMEAKRTVVRKLLGINVA